MRSWVSVGCALLAVAGATAPVAGQIVNRNTTDRFGIAGKDGDMLVEASQRLNQSELAGSRCERRLGEPGYRQFGFGHSDQHFYVAQFALPRHALRNPIQRQNPKADLQQVLVPRRERGLEAEELTRASAP